MSMKSFLKSMINFNDYSHNILENYKNFLVSFKNSSACLILFLAKSSPIESIAECIGHHYKNAC